MGRKIDVIPDEVLTKLMGYHWPGNIRELENVIERSLIISQGRKLELGDWLGLKLSAPKKGEGEGGPAMRATNAAAAAGYVLGAELRDCWGDPARPMSEDAVRRKAVGLMTAADWSPARIEAAVRAIESLPQATDLFALERILQP